MLEGAELQLDQTSLRPGSPVVGQTLGEANIRKAWGLGIVAVQRGAEVVPNPPPDFMLMETDVLVVFGKREEISRFEEKCGQPVPGPG